LAEFDEGPLTSGLFVLGISLRDPDQTLRINGGRCNPKITGEVFERLVGQQKPLCKPVDFESADVGAIGTCRDQCRSATQAKARIASKEPARANFF
jgi:hypothetical protein